MKHLIVFITAFLFFSITARAGDFKVLWETTMAGTSGNPIITDDGKYFFYDGGGYLNVFDSETGIFLHKLKLGESSNRVIEELNYIENKVVLIYSLDSIMIYNIVSNEIEEIIDLNYNITVSNIRAISISPNKRYLSLAGYFNEQLHLIIVDLEQKKLYKDFNPLVDIVQIFNTNNPDRMIVVKKDQHGKHLFEMTLDETESFGFRSKMIEEVDKEGTIRMEKYDADEDAIYYLYLPYSLGMRLSKYEFQKEKVTNLYEGAFLDENIWFSDDNNIILYERGAALNLKLNKSIALREFGSTTQYALSSCEGLETILIREFAFAGEDHKLRRLDISDFLTSVDANSPLENYIYPNPTTGEINIVIGNKHSSIFNYSLLNEQGQIMNKGTLGFLNSEVGAVNIQLPEIPRGMYLLKVESIDESFNFKLIKE